VVLLTVIDRPRFYFTANRIKRLLLLIALFSFILGAIAAQFSITAGTILFGIMIVSLITYVILWFVT
jgi:hypothetical protein